MKVWPYISTLLVGIIIGILLWEKIDYKAIYNGKMKIKQKGTDNQLESDVVVTIEQARAQRKSTRQLKRKLKKRERAVKS